MAWIVENRRSATLDQGNEPFLTEDLRRELREVYFPRYPTKRACLLPALHLVQHAYNWIPMRAIEEVAEFLELSPAEALDTASFYEEYWLKPKGKYLIGVCRSLACEICDKQAITDHLRNKLGVDVGETSADGKFTLIEMECLGACGTAPVALCNEVLHEELTVEKMDRLIASLPDDPHEYKDPTVTWETNGRH
ncbi:MAG: NAD(P)H-dependent oxidoreductase subunit E [Tepidisphaeraceae bacterium]